MMISPESYIEMELSGKSREKALKMVESLRKEIRRLKRIIEETPYSDEFEIKPSPQTRISVSRDYLVAAKSFFKSQGWEYEPSKKEIKDKEFNARLKDLEEIELYYGGFFGKSINCRISFSGSKIIVEDLIVFGKDNEREKSTLPCFDDMTRTSFLRELRDIHMGEWKREYMDPDILDGTQWEVDVRFADGKKQHFSGSNKFPYNFNEFLEVMRIDYE